MKLSVIIPVNNEEESIENTVIQITKELTASNIDHEIIVVNDNSTDNTSDILNNLGACNKNMIIINRQTPKGFGRAIVVGLKSATGEAIVIVMGDLSDDPEDIVKYYNELLKGYDCVFGSRFIKGSCVNDYPILKLIINRLANNFIRILFLLKYNDITNAFKAYKKEVIDSCSPLISNHFNITVELPIKAINRGYSYAVIPVNWYGRISGVSKLKIREMGKKYLFTTLYLWLEKILLSSELRKTK